MLIGETFLIALQSIRGNLFRATLTMLGIVIGVAAVITMVALGTGARQAIDAQMAALGGDILAITSSNRFSRGVARDEQTLTTADASVVLQEQNPPVLCVKVLEDQGRHGLETGDRVTFARLQGCPWIEQGTEYEVLVTGPYTFELPKVPVVDNNKGDNDNNKEHEIVNQQGYITQVKQPVKIKFGTYEQKLKEPGDFVMSDFAKFDRPPMLHLGFQALMSYVSQQQSSSDGGGGGESLLPAPGDKEAANAVLELAKQMDVDNKVFSADGNSNAVAERVLLHLASGSRAVLSPMCAALGGMVGQEALKACSGKFTPINGFFYLDADETLPDDISRRCFPTPGVRTSWAGQMTGW